MSDLRARLRIEGDASSAVAAGQQLKGELASLRNEAAQTGRAMSSTSRETGELARAEAAAAVATDRLDREMAQAAGNAQRMAAGVGRAGDSTQGLNRSASQAHGAIGLLGAGLAAVGGTAFAREITDSARAAAGLTLGMGAVTGGAREGGEQLAFAADEADRLGLVAQRSAGSLVALSGATKGTILEGQQTRDIWLSVSEAGMALGRSQAQIEQGLTAVEQIAGKGVVSMEEVRQQLAEAIPGAVQIAARAMGMTTAEFGEMVEKGDLLATDFLPKFAAQLRQEYGPAIDQYLTTPMGKANVEMARSETNLIKLSAASGQEFMTGITAGLAKLNDELDNPESLARAEQLGAALADGVNLAADAIILLADNLDLIVGSAQALTAVGLVRFLATSAAEAKNAAVAYSLKGAAVRAASEVAVSGAVAENAANTSLRAGLAAIAKSEVARAEAALTASKATLAVANATATEARQTLAATGAGVAYTEAKLAVTRANAALIVAENGVIAAAGRVTVAQRLATASTTAMAGAMTAARGAGSALLAMMGGPWGAALIAAGTAVWFLTDGLREQAEAEREAAGNIRERFAAQEQARDAATQARIETGNLTDAEMDAAVQAAALTGEQDKLADSYWRVAAAAKAAALAQNAKDIQEAESELLTAEKAQRGAAQRLGGATGANLALPGQPLSPLVRRYSDGFNEATETVRQGRAVLGTLRSQRGELQGLRLDTFGSTPSATAAGGSGGSGGGGRGRGRTDRSADVLADLQLEAEAYQAHAIAAIQGEAALDAWAVADAARQAVARAGVEPTSAAGIAIREQAEEVERLGQASDRIVQAASFERQAVRDTEALQRRAAAVAGGRQAVEALRVTEAGLQVLAQQRVATLDQLSAPERAAAEAAMRAAEAKERQAIATEKAEAAAATVEDLNRRIAAEGRRAAALGQGAAAEVEYARAEYVRQAVEAAGLEITDEAAQAIIRKAEALFALTAATDAATAADDFEEQLRLAALSNRERQIALRTELLIRDMLAQQQGLAEGTARAQAENQARMEAWQEDWANATGEIAEDMRRQFIESGELAFDDMGEALKRQLRAAIYDALLAKPINMVINAVMGSAQNSLGSLLGMGGQGGGLGSLFGQGGGLGSLFGQGGAMGGLGSFLPVIGQAAMVAAMGSQLSGGIAGALGGNSKKASQWGVLGLVPGLIAGLTDKADRPYARADVEVRDGQFVFKGAQTADGGDKEGITKAGQALADQLNALSKTFGLDLTKLSGFYTTIGKTEGGNAKALGGDGFFGGKINGLDSLTGQRDVKGWTLGAGVGFSQGQDAEKITEQIIRDTILRAINAGASDLSEAERRFVAAADSLDEAVAYIEKSRGFAQAIEDSILQLTDPAAYEKKKALEAIEASYQALKDEATKMIDAGLIGADVMARLDELKKLQIEDALKKLAGAAGDAGDALSRVQPGMREWLDRQMLGSNAPLNPLEQRNEAFRQYEDVLARAMAGDADALSSLTEYADRLLSADRVATSDASARALLFEEVMADVRALATPASVDPVVRAIKELPGELTWPTLDTREGDAGIIDGLTRLGDQLQTGQSDATRRQTDALTANGEAMSEGLSGVESRLSELLAEIRTQNAFSRAALSRVVG